MSQDTLSLPHPLVRCVRRVAEELDGVTGTDPAYLSTEAKAEVLEGLSRQAARIEGLRLAVLASADDVAEDAGARSAGAWLADRVHADGREGRRWQRLADAVDQRYAATGSALRDGAVSVAQVEVVVAALDALPGDVGPVVRGRAEEQLLADAAHFTPRELRVLGRRVLEVVAPEVAEDHERRALEREERRARDRMRITTRDLGDGMSRALVDLPTLSMDLWLTQLHAFASPRRDHLEQADLPEVERRDPETGARIGYPQRLAQAFCTMLERMPSGVLPAQGGDATTLLVTIDHQDLAAGVGAARLSTGGRLSVGETRRLACNAGIVRWSSVGRRSRWMWAGSGGSSSRRSARRWRCGTGSAGLRAVTSRRRGVRPTTSDPGPPKGGPTWPTGSCCAGSTTTAPTTGATTRPGSPTATSASTDGRRCQAAPCERQ